MSFAGLWRLGICTTVYFDSEYYPDRRLGFKQDGEAHGEAEQTRKRAPMHADCVHAIAARGVLPKSHDIKLRRYYAFAACARSSADDAFLRPAVTIFRILSRELLFPSSDTQASSV